MKTLIFLASLFVSTQVLAGTIFEPSISIGSATGDINTSITNTTTVSAPTDGTMGSFGFRYGITRNYIQLTGMIEGSIFQSNESSDSNFTGLFGLGMGYEWNIPLRTYLFIAAYDFDTDFLGGGVEVAYFIADSTWVGLRASNYKAAAKQVVANQELESELDLTSVSLVVSFPFEFSYPDNWFRKTDWD